MRTKYWLLLVFFLASLGLIAHWQFTSSSFIDTEKILGNSIQVGTWGNTPPPLPPMETLTPTPTETPAITPTEIPVSPSLTPAPTYSPVSSLVVINEVEYDNNQTPESDYEWFEIYNNSNQAVTLENWTISDNSSSDIIPTVTIPPYGFLIVAATDKFLTYYSGFTGLIVYIPDGKIGNGLANSDDRLVLKNSSGTEIDAVSWGNDGYAFGLGNGVKPTTGAGHSISRNPNGYDTDLPTDWVKLISPTPGY